MLQGAQMKWMYRISLGLFITACMAISWTVDAIIFVGQNGNTQLLVRSIVGTSIVFLALIVNAVALGLFKRQSEGLKSPD